MFFENVHHEHNFDRMVLEDVMKDFFCRFQVYKIGCNNIFYELMHGTWNEQ
jgi:hypothetical protein